MSYITRRVSEGDSHALAYASDCEKASKTFLNVIIPEKWLVFKAKRIKQRIGSILESIGNAWDRLGAFGNAWERMGSLGGVWKEHRGQETTNHTNCTNTEPCGHG